jgi:hypothetical protein
MNNENNELKQKIDLLLKEKNRSEMLDRYLDLYEKLNKHAETVPTIWDKLKAMATPKPDGQLTHLTITFGKIDIRDCCTTVRVNTDELLFALRDYYARQILDLTEGENSPQP